MQASLMMVYILIINKYLVYKQFLDEFLVSYGLNLLTIWKINYKRGTKVKKYKILLIFTSFIKEKTGIESIVETFKLDISDKIETLVFSPSIFIKT